MTPNSVLLIGGAFLPLIWLAARRPTVLLLLTLASFSIGLAYVFGGGTSERGAAAIGGLEWQAWQKLALLVALAANVLHFGLRIVVNWPVLALITISAQTLFLAELDPRLTPGSMLQSMISLALPWLFIHVVLEPGSRQRYVLLIVLAPLLSVAIGIVLNLFGLYPVMSGEFRLQGATNAAWLGFLGFTGSIVALHEAMRTGKVHLIYLVFVSMSIVILSGTRMAVLASFVALVSYSLLSEPIRRRLGRPGIAFLLGGCILGSVLFLSLPVLQQRMFGSSGVAVRMSGRDEIWSFYFEEFLLSPLFGRGFGAGGTAGIGLTRSRAVHNEYLRVLVDGGIVGFLLYFGAVALWFVHLIRRLLPHGDRPCVYALIPALAIYCCTDNVLSMPPVMLLYAYFSVMLTRSSRYRASGLGSADDAASDAKRAPAGGAPALGNAVGAARWRR